MELQALRPLRGSQLTQLRKLFEGKGWESTLPESLPDQVLLELARDFRCVEAGITGNEPAADEEAPSLAAAMYVVMSLLMDHPHGSTKRGAMKISEEGLMRAMLVYQISLEREVVTRITGLVSRVPADEFAGELLRCSDA